MSRTDFTAANGVRVTKGDGDLWYTVTNPDQPDQSWSMDEDEDLDIAYAENAVAVLTGWLEYLKDGRA